MISKKPLSIILIGVVLIITSMVISKIFFAAVQTKSAKPDLIAQASPSPICKEILLIFSSDGFDAKNINAKVCDKLIILNQDQAAHKIAFGTHDDHFSYPGFEEKTLNPLEKNEVILTAEGQYEIHDHFNEDQIIQLTVTK